MSLWGTLTGQRQSSSSSPSSPPHNPSPSSPPSLQSTTFDPNTAADVSSFLGDAALPDPSQLHPLAGLNRQTLDYLSLEESALSGKCTSCPIWCSDLTHIQTSPARSPPFPPAAGQMVRYLGHAEVQTKRLMPCKIYATALASHTSPCSL